jgi:hypothetical protein
MGRENAAIFSYTPAKSINAKQLPLTMAIPSKHADSHGHTIHQYHHVIATTKT